LTLDTRTFFFTKLWIHALINCNVI